MEAFGLKYRLDWCRGITWKGRFPMRLAWCVTPLRGERLRRDRTGCPECGRRDASRGSNDYSILAMNNGAEGSRGSPHPIRFCIANATT